MDVPTSASVVDRYGYKKSLISHYLLIIPLIGEVS